MCSPLQKKFASGYDLYEMKSANNFIDVPITDIRGKSNISYLKLKLIKYRLR